jgi:hypothetical protein
MSMPQTDSDVPAPDGAPAPATNRKRGRRLGGKNPEGHKAGRPRGSVGKAQRELLEATTQLKSGAWRNGRVHISV